MKKTKKIIQQKEALKHLEIKTIEHKGVRVILEINYDQGTVSMVEKSMHGYTGKKWLFQGRGLEYMDGWIDILEAMTEATKQAKKDLEHDLAIKSAFDTF